MFSLCNTDLQWCGSGFEKKRSRGSVPRNDENFFKSYEMNILDNIKSFLFCFHTFVVRRSIVTLFRKPARIRIDCIRIRGSRAYRRMSATKSRKTKKKDLKLTRIFIQQNKKKQCPGSGFWPTPNPHHCRFLISNYSRSISFYSVGSNC